MTMVRKFLGNCGKSALLIGLAVCAGLGVSSQESVRASTLAGDTVTLTFQPGNDSLGTFSVGPGIDRTLGNFQFEMNGGLAGDEFRFDDNGGFFSASTSLVLSSLDFSDGSDLSGFSLISSSLSSLTWSNTSNSLTFFFDDPGHGPNNGPAIHGSFLTTAVMEPGTLLLFAAGALGFAAVARHKFRGQVS